MLRVLSLTSPVTPTLASARVAVGRRFKKSLRLDQRWLADGLPSRQALLKLGLVAAFVCGGYLGVLLDMPRVAPVPQPPAPPAPTLLASFSEPPASPPIVAQPLPQIPLEVAKPPPTSPPSSANTQLLSSDEVLEVQAWLKAFGFDPGPLDGMQGPQTAAAVKRYQTARQKEGTGLLDRSLLQQVRQQAGHSSR